MKLYISKKKSVIIGVILLTLGLSGSLPTLYYQWSHNGSVGNHGLPSVSAAPKTTADTPLISGQPVSISIPSLNINLPIINGTYDAHTKQWTLTLNKAQYASITPEPNNIAGNTFIYGHYRPEVFAYLHLIKPGGQAFISTTNGYRFSYRFSTTYATSPSDTSVFTYHGPPMLTLQTCSGTWFQNRQMYFFSYEGYQKI